MSSVSKRKKPPPIVAPIEKAFPSIKTIILKENHPQSKGKPVPADAEAQPGVWSQILSEDIVLEEGDQVILKSSFIDTEPTNSSGGLITITEEDVDQLSITTGMYWQDSGNGVPIEKYSVATFEDDGTMSTPGISYDINGPPPQMSQVMKSDIPAAQGNLPTSRAIPNGQNYILQNQFDTFTNTILYLNTGSADQTGEDTADPTVRSINEIRIHNAGTGYTTGGPHGINQPLTGGTAGSSGARASFATIGSAPAPINSVTMTDEGHGYAGGDILSLPPPFGGVGTTASIEVRTTHVNMSLELTPNSNYDPTSATHEYFDYTITNALETPTVPNPPGGTTYVATPVGTRPTYIAGALNPTPVLTPFITIGNILNLRVRSNPLQGNEFFVYPAEYSGALNIGTPNFPFPVTGTPGENDHMCSLISTTSSTGEPQWNFVENKNWDNLGRPLNQGFVFRPKTAAQGNPTGLINFGSGEQNGTYRTCIGIWAWIWVVGVDSDSGTYPAEYSGAGGKEEYNYYNIELEYYAPGNAEGGGRGSNVSTKTTFSKQWTPAIDKRARLYKWFDDQFPGFVDYSRANYNAPIDPSTKLPVRTQIPPGIEPPSNIFPIPPTAQRPWPHAKKAPQYPSTNGVGYFAPIFLRNMADESSTTAAARNIRCFPPFIYDANPSVHVNNGKDPDVVNFAPFRITASGSLWQGGREVMAGYQQCGFIQQDSRGPIVRNPKFSSQPNQPYIQTAVPPIWQPGYDGFDATTFSNDGGVPKFAFDAQCVISKPFIPGTGSVLTPRVFTTKLKDIPGNTLPTSTTTYTHAAWARLLTDTLNRTSLHNLRLSNQPSSPTYPTNKPTYSSSRILTDTVQLGYQGRNFPSNRVGLGFNYAERPSEPFGFPVADSPFSGYFDSDQPYWVTEDGSAIFRWKDGVPKPAPSGLGGVQPAIEYATVDPITASNPGSSTGIAPDPTSTVVFQQPYVYGQNGPKWAGAEAFSIVFNDTSSAYEIIQMHSNIYSASSGAPIIKTFRSGAAGSPYPDGIQELTVADQTGGVFITDWQPRELWEGRMNFDPTVKVPTGGLGSVGQELNTGDFTAATDLSDTNTTKTLLQRGLNITGNYRAGTDFIDRRVNIPNATGTPDAADLIGGNYQSPVISFNTEVEVDTPVTILGHTITPSEIKDPFFMIEVNGINSNEMHGLSTSNNLISSIVGRYFAVGSYTQGSSEGSIAYTHRGEPLTIRKVGIRILASDGSELTSDTLKGDSAVILEIAGQEISLTDPPVVEK